jgi:protein SCO1/2
MTVSRKGKGRAALLGACLSLLAGAPGRGDEGRPVAAGAGLTEQLGASVTLDLRFRDEEGRLITLGEAAGGKPFILALVYYRCPMLCNLVLGGVLETLIALGPTAGREFTVVTVSFDPSEGPDLARAKKTHYLRAYGRPSGERGWRFLTDQNASAERLCRETGFRIVYDSGSGQYAHAGAILVLTPQGRISRYFMGISYPERDVRLSLVEASAGKIGSAADQLLLLCFKYDPASGKYTLAVWRILRGLSILTVGAILLLVVLLNRRRRPREDSRETTDVPSSAGGT